MLINALSLKCTKFLYILHNRAKVYKYQAKGGDRRAKQIKKPDGIRQFDL